MEADLPHATRRAERRSSAVDAVRVLATATVVAGHAFSAHPWAHRVFFSWHVPVFCVLSGYLWSERRGFGEELRRRVRQLLVPFLAWLVLVAALWRVVLEHRGVEPVPHLFTDLLKGAAPYVPFAQYWFLTALFFVVLYARLLRDLRLIAVAGLAGVVAIEVWTDQLRAPWWSAGLAWPMLTFLAAGIALRRARPGITRPLTFGLALVGAGALLLLAGVAPMDLKQGDLGTPGLGALAGTLISVGLVLAAEGFFVGARHHVAALSVLATAAMPVVLGHTLVLAVLADQPLDAPVWVFLVALVVPWAGGLVATRVPVVRTLFL